MIPEIKVFVFYLPIILVVAAAAMLGRRNLFPNFNQIIYTNETHYLLFLMGDESSSDDHQSIGVTCYGTVGSFLFRHIFSEEETYKLCDLLQDNGTTTTASMRISVQRKYILVLEKKGKTICIGVRSYRPGSKDPTAGSVKFVLTDVRKLSALCRRSARGIYFN